MQEQRLPRQPGEISAAQYAPVDSSQPSVEIWVSCLGTQEWIQKRQREKQERGGANTGAEGSLQLLPSTSCRGFQMEPASRPPSCQRGESQNVITAQVPWSWWGCTSCQAHFGSKSKKNSVYQQNLMLMERTMPKSTVKPFEGVETNGSSPCIFLDCVCGLANFVIPVKC